MDKFLYYLLIFIAGFILKSILYRVWRFKEKNNQWVKNHLNNTLGISIFIMYLFLGIVIYFHEIISSAISVGIIWYLSNLVYWCLEQKGRSSIYFLLIALVVIGPLILMLLPDKKIKSKK
jgi:hypothetical protein